MIDSGNWLVPLWFDKIILDRTIGIQIILAISQKLFGETSFRVYFPISISSCAMLFLTYLIHKELLDEKYAIISPLILSSTFYGLIMQIWQLRIFYLQRLLHLEYIHQ